MLDERELEEFFAGQPKPALRPFLGSRTAALAKSKPRRLRMSLYLIWTAVLVACWLAIAQSHVPGPAIAVVLAACFPVLLRRGRRIGPPGVRSEADR